ncbi:hypothetical protein ACRRTK_004290 [Alexandromys fortis]
MPAGRLCEVSRSLAASPARSRSLPSPFSSWRNKLATSIRRSRVPGSQAPLFARLGWWAHSDVLALPIFKQEEPQLSPENGARLPPLQYVLCAATSPAVKLHEETLTYLNQGRDLLGVEPELA